MEGRAGKGTEGKGRDGYVDGTVLLRMWRFSIKFLFCCEVEHRAERSSRLKPGVCLLKNLDELSSASECFQEVV